MPLVAHTPLPTFERLRQEGEPVVTRDTAVHQDIREIHIGLLNMMPDSALAATERQFFRLIGESNAIAQFYMHPFTLKELSRGAEGQAHVAKYYETFDQIKTQGLDALIVSGANVTQPDLSREPFLQPLSEVIEWAWNNVTSTLCSCLATHAVLQFRYGQKRKHLGFKRWGVFPHRVVDRRHPLVVDVNTRFDVPHSRFNEITRDQFEAAGLHVLVESETAGVHLATSADGFRQIFFQGHPEYDTVSLLKEYKREVMSYSQGKRTDYPPLLDNYFTPKASGILEEHREQVEAARLASRSLPDFPESLVSSLLDNTWHDTAEAVIDNWVGKVYQLTHLDRKKPFQDAVNPSNPLGLR